MSDFTSSFWSWFIIAIVVGGFVWMVYLLMTSTRSKIPSDELGKPTGHVWDENLEELNNPLPRWWLYMFYITMIFGVIYLALYPGLGTFKGLLGWTAESQYAKEVEAAKAEYAPLYDAFLKQDIAALAADDGAMKTGERLFVNYCAVCHGSDARGALGFPNLRDSEWQYGGEPENIKYTIINGRQAAMPPLGDAVGGDAGVTDVANYVMQMSGRLVDEESAARGKAKFDMICAGCHMPDGTGNTALGAPNLTNNIWLYGGSPRAIKHAIVNGRQGYMPPQGKFLGDAKVHVLTAYVYSLAHEQD